MALLAGDGMLSAPEILRRTVAGVNRPISRERALRGSGLTDAEPFAMTQQAISKHLKVLERAGLISRGRTAQSRPRALHTAELDHAIDWITRHRQVWAERYDRLDDHLAAIQAHHPLGSS